MSRQKTTIDDLPYKDLGEKLRTYRGSLSQEEFAKLLNISVAAYGNYERGERQVTVRVLRHARDLSLSSHLNKDRETWIVGDEETAHTIQKDSTTQKHIAMDVGDDAVLAEDLMLARKLLTSKTLYGPALHFNIRQFNAGLEAEKKAAQVDQLQRDVNTLKTKFSALEEERVEKEARIRAGDPIEQKEEFLRKRAGLLP